MVPWLGSRIAFPPVETALRQPNGLLAAGGDLSWERLLAAYGSGIFPWFSEGEPILWWSPDPRMVLFPGELKVPRSLAKNVRNKPYEVRVDTAFGEVMAGCAAPRDASNGTWITDEMLSAYGELHRRGYAHSIETWIDGRLAGGLYGIALGRAFFGESMFTRVPDASKIAFVHLVRQLVRWEFGIVDCQMRTDHLARFGAREIPRSEFSRILKHLIHYPTTPGGWTFDDDLAW